MPNDCLQVGQLSTFFPKLQSSFGQVRDTLLAFIEWTLEKP